MPIVVKTSFKGRLCRFQFDGTTVAELRDIVVAEYRAQHFLMRYENTENEFVPLVTADDLENAARVALKLSSAVCAPRPILYVFMQESTAPVAVARTELIDIETDFKSDVRRSAFEGATMADVRALVTYAYGVCRFVLRYEDSTETPVTLVTDKGLELSLRYAVDRTAACLCLSVHQVESEDVAAATSAMARITI